MRKTPVTRLLTFLTLIFLTSLACAVQVPATPNALGTSVPPSSTPRPTATAAATATEAEAAQVAVVRAAVVNMRSNPDGEVVLQLVAGSDVTLTGDCDGDGWCPVSAINTKGETVEGYIFEGCLSVTTERKCEAAP